MRDDPALEECARYDINTFSVQQKSRKIWWLQKKCCDLIQKAARPDSDDQNHWKLQEVGFNAAPEGCAWTFISINSNTLVENEAKWPTCDSNPNSDIHLLTNLIGCPHCIYSLCWRHFFSIVRSSISLFSVWHTGEKAAERVGAICLQQTGFWHLLWTATINTVRAYVMKTHTSVEL